MKMLKVDFVNGLKEVLIEKEMGDYVLEILDEVNGIGRFEDNSWLVNTSDCLVCDIILDEVDLIIEEYCENNNVEIVV
jgi:hypothetical protein